MPNTVHFCRFLKKRTQKLGKAPRISKRLSGAWCKHGIAEQWCAYCTGAVSIVESGQATKPIK